ncbi:tripartite tricarboxylate transporter TctB family protein [Tropicimonas sediminicola]|uniref:Tripartite tricarboxylate transporter TctB family protein n=1 Tax=Tropicimonas sediminicola TaxID=1031541 RepID=A0A239M5R2_9RHOB|nr:tripartite tricarboxylate transporter TctB family protein [Tropicimonas sediminicola]SNT37453.1 Tripartite tricarboxylate transporter TctB family protein [Tropicimonas sediminicola]
MAKPAHDPERRQDVIAGSILLLFALAWTVTVWLTVPDGYGVGPRAFPLWLGVALAVLSALLLLKGMIGVYEPPLGEKQPDEDAPDRIRLRMRLGVVATVTVIIAAFGWLMPKIGFVPATALTVAVTLVGPLGERRWLLVLGMALGIAVGAWLAFGQILGAYMPSGSWISIF